MIIYKRINDLKEHFYRHKDRSASIGFVPTMGALHKGHISLIEASRKNADVTVCSIFINPSQFNNQADFTKYPVTIENDILQLETAGCDILLLPSLSEIYPDGYEAPHYELGYLENILEGAFRPGHFQGVCQVVDRLLQIVEPQHLFLGEKDYQQCMVITRLAEILRLKVKIQIIPTLREKDGLAMSSRNMRLTPAERKSAAFIYATLKKAAEQIDQKDTLTLQGDAKQNLESHGFKVDYFEIADAATLLPSKPADAKKVIVVAAWLNDVRLIDNLVTG